MQRIFLFIFFLFVCLSLMAQDWVIQHPFSEVVTIRDIDMKANGTGFAVGDGGIVLKTTDFGEKWELKETPLSVPYRNIHCLKGSNNQIVLAGGQKLIRSIDGGESWESADLSLNNIQAIHSLDANIVFINTLQDGVFKSVDGGASWENIEDVLAQSYEDLYFFDEENGIVTASIDNSYQFISTNDGGMSWTIQDGEYNYLSRMDFSSDMVGFTVGHEDVLKTVDGGNTWSPMADSPNANDVVAIDDNNIWVLRGLGYHFSMDGGITWSDSQSPNGGGNTQGIDALDAQTVWITQANTTIKLSSDGGTTWTDQIGGPKGSLDAFDMLNEDFGMAGSPRDYILKTTDGGAVWESIPIDDDFIITNIKVVDIQNAIASGRDGMIRSTDSGMSWSAIPSLDEWYTSLYYFSNERILGGTISGDVIQFNIDGSTKMILQNLGTEIKGIDFTDENTGFATTRAGFIYRTQNGGETWNQMYDNNGDELSTVYAINQDIILVSPRFGPSILRSSDGGDSWTEVPVVSSTFWNSFSFYDDLNGYLAGGSATQGRILRTSDAGENWELDFDIGTAFMKIKTPTPGERLAWAVGNGGLIVRYSDCNTAPALNTLNVLDLVCTNDTVSLEVEFEGVDLFEWTIPAGFTVLGNDVSARIDLLAGNTSGTVSVKGLNSCGDESEELSVSLDPMSNPDPVITETDMVLTCQTDAAAFQWFLDGEAIAGANRRNYTPAVSGTYTVVITSANGCTSRPSNQIEVIVSSVIDINELGVALYPNPVSNALRITGLLKSDKIYLFNIHGQQIMTLSPSETAFDLNQLQSGVYFIQIIRGIDQAITKLIVQ